MTSSSRTKSSLTKDVSVTAGRPNLRLLFDELLSWRVASALRELGIRASHVGHAGDNAPSRGSSDAAVLHHAKTTKQVVVTSNHDMILLCAEENESVIWIDPRGRQLKRTEFVPLAFNRVEGWDLLLTEAEGPICIHVLRTKTEVLPLERARHLVVQRMRRLQARKRSAAKEEERGNPTLYES